MVDGAWWRIAVFVAAAVFAASPYGSAAVGLGLGAALALTIGSPLPKAGAWSKPLIQVCVVLLGLNMDLTTLLDAGRRGIVLAALTIATTLAAGAALGRLLGIERHTSLLVSSGTAICGGSAIAAVGAATGASRAQMSVALGTVFLLNAAGLFLFPPLGHALGLDQDQFGVWAGTAVHDVSSVVGATAAYGDHALHVGTAVKLSRTLWIVPLALGASRWVGGGSAKVQVPWFILAFLAASVARTAWAPIRDVSPVLVTLARSGFALALFLVGTDLSREVLREVGWRVFVQGAALWLLISALSLAVVLES